MLISVEMMPTTEVKKPIDYSHLMAEFSTGILYSTSTYLACTCGGIYPGRVEPASSIFNDDASWVGSTQRSPVPASLYLLALQLMSSLSGLFAPEHPLFTPSLLVLIQVTRRGKEFDRQRCAD